MKLRVFSCSAMAFVVSFGISRSVGLTYHAFSCERPPVANGRAARRPPPIIEYAICGRRDAVQFEKRQALQRRASERPLVRCYAELAAVIVVRGSRAPRMNERQQRLAPLNLASVSRRSR